MKKILALLIIASMLLAGCIGGGEDTATTTTIKAETTTTIIQAPATTTTEPLLGGDRDEHGCIPSAGYSWCETKQKCLRIWEESCPGMDELACETDADCIPLPSDCHPHVCINLIYRENYESPEVCTMMYDNQAAYTPEDCACVDGQCANKKLSTGEKITIQKAYEIAENSDCIAEGPLGDVVFYNENTGTWWIDLDVEKPGCAPACVVSEESQTAEINWRCTGLIPPAE
ncbi:MAG TPA: hypothetical protein ENN13_04395 [Candidatus Altiarchaeales archaeon]|nr:hypothetical protein [Candidatus Altiarchaeales archaeon]